MDQSEFRPVKHLKMFVWTSVFWKMNIHMAKKMVIALSFISIFHFQSDYRWNDVTNVQSVSNKIILLTSNDLSVLMGPSLSISLCDEWEKILNGFMTTKGNFHLLSSGDACATLNYQSAHRWVNFEWGSMHTRTSYC